MGLKAALTSNHRNKITQEKVLPLSQQLEMTALSSRKRTRNSGLSLAARV